MRAQERRRKIKEIAEHNAMFQAKKRDEAARNAAAEMTVLQNTLAAHQQETQRQQEEKV